MNSNSSMAGLASLVQSRGRNGDSMLVHMGPEEVQGLQSIALAHGGSLTINPVTGMVEANFLKKLLPAIAGFTLNSLFPGMGTLGTSLLVGGATGLIEGDLKKGINAGMGAYSGANIRQALARAGQAAKAEAAKKLTGSALSGPSKVDVEMPLGQDILEMTAPKAAVTPTVAPTPALNLAQPRGILDRVGQSKFGQSDMGAGIMSLFRPGGGEQMVKYLGGPNQAGMTFAPIMSAIDEAEQERNAKKMRQITEGENYFYIPGEFNKQSGKFEPGRYVDAKGNPYTKPFKWGFADGGVIPSQGNMYPMARLQAGGMGGYDTPIDSMSGQEFPVTNFAEGGTVDPLEDYYRSLLAPPSSTNPNQADVDANTKYVDEWNKIFAGGMRDFGGKGDSAASYYQASTAPAPVYDTRAESDPFDTTTPVKEDPIDKLPVKTKEPEPVNTFKPTEAPPADPITFQPNPEPSPIDDFLEQYPITPPKAEPPKAEPPKAEPPQQTVTKVEEIIPGTVEGGGFELDTGPVPSDFVEPEPVQDPRTGTVTIDQDVSTFKPEPNKPTSVEEFLAATDPNKAKEPEKDYFSTFTPAEPEPVTIAPEAPPYTETYGSTSAIDEFLAATDPNKAKEPEKDYFSTFTPRETKPTTIDDFLRDNPVESMDNDTAQQNWVGKALDYLESSGGTTGGSIAAARSVYQDWKDGKLSWDSAKSALKGFVEGFIPGSEKVFKKPEEAPKETPPVADQNTSNYDEEQFMGSDYSTDPFQSQDPDFWNEYSVSLPDLVEDLPTLTTRGMAAGGPTDFNNDYYNFGFARGGLGTLPEYKAGGKLLRGPGDGMSDDIPAVIRGAKVQRAALADGEFVIPADVVSHLGNGSTEAGAKKLYQMMDKIRVARTGNKRQGRQINPDKFIHV